MNEPWIREVAAEISAESLPEGYQALAEVIGLENALRAAQCLGGLVYYFPKLDRVLIEKRDALIKKEFNGNNYKELARKYSLSERQIREIVRNKPAENQTELF